MIPTVLKSQRQRHLLSLQRSSSTFSSFRCRVIAPSSSLTLQDTTSKRRRQLHTLSKPNHWKGSESRVIGNSVNGHNSLWERRQRPGWHSSSWNDFHIRPLTTVSTENQKDEEEEDAVASSSLYRSSPLWEADNYYREHHEISESLSSLIRTNSTELPGARIAWTAELTCPVTGRILRSGKLRSGTTDIKGADKAMELNLVNHTAHDDEQDEDGSSDDDSDEEDDSSSRKTERSVFYPRKTVAIQAAAARALDFMRCHDYGQLKPRLCVEDPSIDTWQPVATIVDPDSPAAKPQSKTSKGKAGKKEEEKSTDQDSDDYTSNKLLFRNSPLWELDNYYRTMMQHPLEKPISESMTCEMETYEGKPVWTAKFHCPVSHRDSTSGTLRPSYAANPGITKHPGNSYEIVRPHPDRPKKKVKYIFYERKATAINAAAARALDLLRSEREGILEPRLCDQDPLVEELSEDLSEDEDTDAEEETSGNESDDEEEEEEEIDLDIPMELPQKFIKSRSMVSSESLPIENVAAADIAASPKVDEVLTTQPSTPNAPGVDEETETEYFNYWEEDDLDPDQVVVHHLPSPTENDQSPALQLLTAITQSSTSTGNSLLTSSAFPTFQDSASGSAVVQRLDDRYDRLADEADAWVNSAAHIKPSPSLHGIALPRKQKSSTTLILAKSLLASLGDANYSNLSRSQSTQGPAYAILNFLWDSKDSKPDTEVYNLYLRCLEAADPVTRAIRAEAIVGRMKNRGKLQGEIPPEPDANTFNTLLGIWAQVGGENGRYSKLDDSFKPSRESFLAVLSSSSYTENEKDVFDYDFAKQCVTKMVRMQKWGEGYDRLTPDNQVMNAPLRWSGGLLWNKTRPNTRRIEWENYMSIYFNGFRPYSDTDPLVENATKVEQWVRNMTDFDVSPDIESYEAMIQAWVRTGTREGLEKAENMIEEITSSPDMNVRIQTFHPIFAAWLHVQHNDSPQKILKWITYLRDLDDESVQQAVDSDRRLVCLELASHILQQDRTTGEDLFDVAKQCSNTLDKLVTEIKESSDDDYITKLHLLSEPFLLTMTVWGRAIPEGCKVVSTYHSAIRAMLQVVDQYEAVLRDAANREARMEGPGVAGFSDELRFHAMNSNRVYSCLVSQLRDLEKKQDQETSDPGTPSVLLPFLTDIERVVRRMAETHEIGKTSSSSAGKQDESMARLVYADRYNYSFERLMPEVVRVRADRVSDYWNIVGLLENIPTYPHHNFPDVVSLCYILKMVGPASTRKSNFDEKINVVLDRVLTGGQHRDSILASMRVRGGGGPSGGRHVPGSTKRYVEKGKDKARGVRRENSGGSTQNKSRPVKPKRRTLKRVKLGS